MNEKNGAVYIMNLVRYTIFSAIVLSAFMACSDSKSPSSPEADFSSSAVTSSSSSVVKSSSSNALSSSSIVYSTITDARDGQKYKVVTIGSQEWMAENLNYEYKVDSVTYGNYVNLDYPEYGRFYTWGAAMDSAAVFSKNGEGCGRVEPCVPPTTVRGVCPEGFRLPNESDFETLSDAVGGQAIAGQKLKSTSGWYDNANGTDGFGFSALPVGIYNNKTFVKASSYAHFWTTRGGNIDYAFYMGLYFDSKSVFINSSYKYYGYSVRCLKSN